MAVGITHKAIVPSGGRYILTYADYIAGDQHEITGPIDFGSQLLTNIKLGGAMDANSQSITSVNEITGRPGGTFYITSNHASDLMQFTARRTAANAGPGYVWATYSNLDADSNRLSISSGVATAIAAWTNITHTGLKLGGAMDANGQNITSIGLIGAGIASPENIIHGKGTVADTLVYIIKINHSSNGVGAGPGILFASNAIDVNRGKGAIVYTGTTNFDRGKLSILQESTADTSQPTLADSIVDFNNDGSVVFKPDRTNPTLQIEDGVIKVDVDGALETISVGANDSGGAGFKYLRIPN